MCMFAIVSAFGAQQISQQAAYSTLDHKIQTVQDAVPSMFVKPRTIATKSNARYLYTH